MSGLVGVGVGKVGEGRAGKEVKKGGVGLLCLLSLHCQTGKLFSSYILHAALMLRRWTHNVCVYGGPRVVKLESVVRGLSCMILFAHI